KMSPLCLLSFFFQAEDGIRDRNVTGVQTCALPILRGDLDINETKLRNHLKAEIHPADITPESGLAAGFIGPKGLPEGVKVVYDRSEERRVGKECRGRRPPNH